METPTYYKALSRELKRDLLFSGKYGIKIVRLKKHKPDRHKKEFLKEWQV